MGYVIEKEVARKRLELQVKRFKNDLNKGVISGTHQKTTVQYKVTSSGKKYNETQVRQGYVLPLFRDILGWDIDNSINEVIPELYNHEGFADFVFVRNNQKKFVLETKRPSVNIDPNTESGREGARQAIGYARSIKDVHFSIVSNFELLVFCHSYSMPPKGKELSNVINWFHFEDFLLDENFETLWEFRFERAGQENFAECFKKNIDKNLIKKYKAIDDALLDDLQKIRVLLANAISGLFLSAEDADVICNEIINKIVVARALEDRNIIQTTIRGALGDKNPWEDFKKYMKSLSKTLPISVFEIGKTSSISNENITLESKVFHEVVQMFYDRAYAGNLHDVYDFKFIPADILGYAYENSISYKLSYEKKSFKLRRKEFFKDGVHYTPLYICRDVVSKSIGQVLNFKDLKDVKVADIACGSGSFLTAVYDFLYKNYYNESSKFSNDGVKKVLPLETRKKILENNIWGVDIDYFASEVAKVALYLKYFEDFPIDEKFSIDSLPRLENIICADSLIDTNLKLKLTKAAKPICSAHSKFLSVIKNGGFDSIVGNPPYIKIQDLLKLEDIPLEIYKELYNETFSEGALEFAIAFIQRGVGLLQPNGTLGFIIPNKMFSNKQGKGIREFLTTSETHSVFEITDFHSCQIFDASIYTCLLFVEKNSTFKNKIKVNNIYRADDISHTLNKCNHLSEKSPSNDFEVGKVNRSDLKINGWEINVETRKSLLEKLRLQPKKLLDVIPEGKVFQGIPTGADPVFLVRKVKNITKNTILIYSDSTDSEHEIEIKYLKPVLKGSTNLKLFNKIDSDFYLIYPYSNGVLVEPKDLKGSLTYEYLSLRKNRETLERRENGKFAGNKFYQYSRPQNLNLWESDKILVPYLVEKFNAHFDTSKNIFVNVSTGGYGIIPPTSEKERIILLLVLNSSVFNFYIKSNSGDFRGGWFECSKHYLSDVPVPDISNVNIDFKKINQAFAENYEINKELLSTTNPMKRTKLKLELSKNLDWLNEQVMDLYSLNDEEKDLLNFYDSNVRDSDIDDYYKDLIRVAELLEDGEQASLGYLKFVDQ